HVSTLERFATPAARARSTSSSSGSPSEPSSGWFRKRASWKSKKSSGEYSATQAAAFAARKEYWFPADLSSAIGWISSVAAPEVTQVRNCSELFLSKVPQLAHR